MKLRSTAILMSACLAMLCSTPRAHADAASAIYLLMTSAKNKLDTAIGSKSSCVPAGKTTSLSDMEFTALNKYCDCMTVCPGTEASFRTAAPSCDNAFNLTHYAIAAWAKECPSPTRGTSNTWQSNPISDCVNKVKNMRCPR